jgi:flagellar protein FliJ
MTFLFKLQSLLNWKKSLEELAQKELAVQLKELRKEEEEIEALILKRIGYDQELKEKSAQGIPSGEYLTYQQYSEQTYKELINREEKKGKRLQDIERAREKLLVLSKERKILGKLREKRYKKYLYESERKDQSTSDERAVQQFKPSSR